MSLMPVCTCGDIMANIEVPYQNDIKELCQKYNIDKETMSRGVINNDEFNAEKKAILDKYTDPDNICTRMRLMNFCDIVEIIGD